MSNNITRQSDVLYEGGLAPLLFDLLTPVRKRLIMFLFEEPGTLAAMAPLARHWFQRHLGREKGNDD
ncbi:MAG: hypothetical protein R3C14_26755 [Caldilineaceae bacterium]